VVYNGDMKGWRIAELDHRREEGWLRLAPDSTGPRVLAQADGDRIVVHDRQVTCIGSGERWRWTYTCQGLPQDAHVSTDRLLVTTHSLDYHAWGLLGPALLLDLDDGAVVAELRGERGAALDGGRFVLGLEGYDVFNTWMHDRDGTLLATWRTYGHYVVDPDQGIRVVECDRRVPTRSRVVRLLPAGLIEPGPHLVHGQVPRPIVLGDGTIVLLDAGVLRAVDRGLNDTVLAKLLPIPAHEAWRFSGELALDGDRLSVALAERARDAPTEYTTHRWTLVLTRSS
jgi:hypothetical protein